MKKSIITLLVLLSALLVFTGCGKKKEKEEIDVKVITEEEVIKDQEVDGLKLTNTSLTRVDNNWTLITEVANNTGADYKLDEFTIIFKDAEGNVVATLPGYVGGTIPNGSTRTINSSTIRDLSNVTKVEYEVKK